MALYFVLLPILLNLMVVSGQDDDLPFNTTGLTPIYVHQDDRAFLNDRHYNSHRPSGSSCNSLTFLYPGTSSIFTSPRYPTAYPPNQRCQYVFKSLDHSCNIQIQCSFFQLPFSYFCRSTNLFMQWGLGLNERKCWCGSNLPSTVVSSSYWAYAKFSSIQWWNWSYRGFRCMASTICPTTTTAPTTMKTSTFTTTAPTTAAPTTVATTTVSPTTVATTTVAPTTVAATTAAPTTVAATTAAPTTFAATTAAPTTAAPITVAATTAAATTAAPTTVVAITAAPTATAQTTLAPTTADATTASPTTLAPSTVAPTMAVPTTAAPTTVVATTA